MQLTVNGKNEEVGDGATVAELLAGRGIEGDAAGVAVAVNNAVVPRNEWGATPLHDGDAVEIIHAVQGG